MAATSMAQFVLGAEVTFIFDELARAFTLVSWRVVQLERVGLTILLQSLESLIVIVVSIYHDLTWRRLLLIFAFNRFPQELAELLLEDQSGAIVVLQALGLGVDVV